MLTRIESTLRRWRRKISRSEWLVHMLRLPINETEPNARGLVLIQIDGLARSQLEKALAKGRMPFLKKLLKDEHYHLEHLYSGVPATTPAVQAEIFYGVRSAVPAFGFMSQESQEMMRMYESGAATHVEKKLTATGQEPLLRDGSCYVSVYKAGTEDDESHFCPASLGWGRTLREAGPLTIIVLLIMNFWSVVRTAGLLLIEFVIALVDFFRGLTQGQDFLRELMFIPTRIAITILMRELSTLGVKVDIARGMPVIYLNLLGYDEQAHRRGPSSKFAHWTLKGIDNAIHRIWRAAHRSSRRHYDVWIYSDHGQEDSVPYETLHGRPIADAITSALAELPTHPSGYRTSGRRGIQLQRVRLFGGQWLQKLFPVDDPDNQFDGDAPMALSAMGPLALLYNLELNGADPAEIAQLLVEKTKVPLVLYRGKKVGDELPILGWWREGPVELPRDGRKVLGEDHPFFEEAAEDLANLCKHPDSGSFVLCGWCAGSQAMTFAIENGSHGGAGPNETHAFALMPKDIMPTDKKHNHWRPSDLRNAAMHFMRNEHTPWPKQDPNKSVRKLRIMTYNVHICRGMDGKLSPQRIARIIARYAPDIVALQEVDVLRERTGSIDQVQQIARALAMECHFQPAMHMEGERYGDAILSRRPLRLIKKDILPGPSPKTRHYGRAEPRGALWVEIECGGHKLQIVNTHLGLGKGERLRQVKALLSEDWLGSAQNTGPRILVGDFNALPNSDEFRLLKQHMRDAQMALPGHNPLATFFSRLPQARIDHVFIEDNLQVTGIQVPRNELTRLASDHLPLIVDVEVPVTEAKHADKPAGKSQPTDSPPS